MRTAQSVFREALDNSPPFGLSLSNPVIPRGISFDKLRANGIIQSFPGGDRGGKGPVRPAASRLPLGALCSVFLTSHL
jgi:hypothetical protein